MIDEGLKEFATERQKEIIDAINEYGSQRKAAQALNVCQGTIQSAYDAVRKRAALHGYSPQHDMLRIVPEPFIVRGHSTLYDADGKPKLQWVKTSLDQQKLNEMAQAILVGMKDEIPRVSMMAAPPHGNDNLLNCYVITDYHLGMLSWKEETGADWDLKIGEDTIIKWFSQAIQQSPDANQAIFAQLSDFLHFDGMDAVTPASKHLLDVDTRFAKVVRSAIRILRTVVDMLLQKHQKVHIIMADANHDPVSQIWLREWFSAMYENEPRITVDTLSLIHI